MAIVILCRCLRSHIEEHPSQGRVAYDAGNAYAFSEEERATQLVAAGIMEPAEVRLTTPDTDAGEAVAVLDRLNAAATPPLSPTDDVQPQPVAPTVEE